MKSTALPSITGLRGESAEIAEAQDRGAVGDDGDQIALGGIVIGGGGVFGDGEHGHRDAGRIGQRQVALRRHRLGRDDLDLAGASLGMEQQGLALGELVGGFVGHARGLRCCEY
ncbi:hypothetical protein QE379_003627 [Sphingomonas sp. SORGH_AS 879]|nr:hypothetical protein [Sphingomonas sp. SORGH_AS_0879]